MSEKSRDMTSRLDRDAAREVLRAHGALDIRIVDAFVENLLDALEGCVRERPSFGWDDMLDLLRTTYPEWMIPQYAEADYGNGPQIVSLLRLVAKLRVPTGCLVLTSKEAERALRWYEQSDAADVAGADQALAQRLGSAT